MNKLHQNLLKKAQEASKDITGYKDINKYLGTLNKVYNLPSSSCKLIIREFKKANKDISVKDFYELLNSLNDGESFEEKMLVGSLLIAFPSHRKEIDVNLLDKWLEKRQGWCEIDSLCQSSFGHDEVLSRWIEWEKLVDKFVKSKYISKRRASLVLLIKSVRGSDDKRLSDTLFANIDKLKLEKDVLITKAVSWALRGLIKNHKAEVKKYLDANINSLPKIAVRETKRKLETGKK